jgi:hypothetical protein
VGPAGGRSVTSIRPSGRNAIDQGAEKAATTCVSTATMGAGGVGVGVGVGGGVVTGVNWLEGESPPHPATVIKDIAKAIEAMLRARPFKCGIIRFPPDASLGASSERVVKDGCVPPVRLPKRIRLAGTRGTAADAMMWAVDSLLRARNVTQMTLRERDCACYCHVPADQFRGRCGADGRGRGERNRSSPAYDANRVV